MSLTRWYESIREHYHDELTDDILNDDDVLDGWWILKERERPKKQDRLVESSQFNVENFVMAKTPEEAQEIWKKNDKIAQGILKFRAGQIFGDEKNLGIQNEKLGDNALDVQMSANIMANKVAQMKARGIRTTTGRR